VRRWLRVSKQVEFTGYKLHPEKTLFLYQFKEKLKQYALDTCQGLGAKRSDSQKDKISCRYNALMKISVKVLIIKE
jgi:hypothetical protein